MTYLAGSHDCKVSLLLIWRAVSTYVENLLEKLFNILKVVGLLYSL